MSKLTTNERAIVVTALRHAVPYIRMYKRKVFVLKAGGDAFVSPEMTRALLEQIGILHQVGIRVVVVHGGGPQSTELSKRLGLETRMVDGRRIVLAYTMTINDRRISSSQTTFEFAPTGAGTTLVMTEQAAFFDGADGQEMREAGWRELLGQLGREVDRAAAAA